MNKIFKIGYIALCSVLAMNFTACTEEVEYTLGEKSPVAETQVYFLASNPAAPVMAKDDSQLKVLVGRTNGNSAQSFPLIVNNPNDSVFTIPTTIDFAAGETEKELIIQTSDKMKLYQSYYFKLEIPAEFVNPYVEQENHPILVMNVLKEDYIPYATGTYTAGFFSNQSWKQLMEYSPILNSYRFPDLWANGYDVEFNWDGKTITCAKTTVQSGYIHSTYGMCSATSEATLYKKETNTFLFQYKWTVSAGSFGSYVDQFVIEELK